MIKTFISFFTLPVSLLNHRNYSASMGNYRFLMRYSILLLFILNLSACHPYKNKDNKLSTGSPHEVSISKNRIAKIDTLICTALDSNWIGGASALVARHGKVIYYKSFGYANDKHEKLRNDAIFRIASQTKAITSVGIMILFEDGKILLDDPVSKYLPEFKEPKLLDIYYANDTSFTTQPAMKEITIRHLLTHTSGLDYFSFGTTSLNSIYYKSGIPSIFGSDSISLDSFIKKLSTLPLAHQPGERFTYGLSTDVLGRVIEVVSKMTLDEFFRKKIFEPLAMNDTYFYVPQEKVNRLVSVFDRTSTGLKVIHGKDDNSINVDYPYSKGIFFSGGAGLCSTLEDYAKFLQMLLNKGNYNNQQLLSRRTVELMTTNQIENIPFRNGNKFGLGFEIFTQEGQLRFGQTEGSFAWGGYYGTTYWADPGEDIIGLLFINQRHLDKGDLQSKFKVLVYQSLTD